jgi:hypothetical protein
MNVEVKCRRQWSGRFWLSHMNFEFIYFYLAYDKLFGKRCNSKRNKIPEPITMNIEVVLRVLDDIRVLEAKRPIVLDNRLQVVFRG